MLSSNVIKSSILPSSVVQSGTCVALSVGFMYSD